MTEEAAEVTAAITRHDSPRQKGSRRNTSHTECFVRIRIDSISIRLLHYTIICWKEGAERKNYLRYNMIRCNMIRFDSIAQLYMVMYDGPQLQFNTKDHTHTKQNKQTNNHTQHEYRVPTSLSVITLFTVYHAQYSYARSLLQYHTRCNEYDIRSIRNAMTMNLFCYFYCYFALDRTNLIFIGAVRLPVFLVTIDHSRYILACIHHASIPSKYPSIYPRAIQICSLMQLECEMKRNGTSLFSASAEKYNTSPPTNRID